MSMTPEEIRRMTLEEVAGSSTDEEIREEYARRLAADDEADEVVREIEGRR